MSDKDILKLMEPITHENIHELQPGEWIWDDETIYRKVHRRSLGFETIEEPIGFRQVHILDLEMLQYGSKPFKLSSAGYCDTRWEYFRPNRFHKFKKLGHKVKVRKRSLGDVVKRLEKDIAELEKED